MARRITVGLPDDQVCFLDPLVAEGKIRSRADGVRRAVTGLQRQHRVAADLRRLQEAGVPCSEEMLAIAPASSTTPLPFD